MYFATIQKDDGDSVIVVNQSKSRYSFLQNIIGNKATSLLEFIRVHTKEDIEKIKKELDYGNPFYFDDFKFNAPIPYPQRNAFCLGKNYLDHLKEIPMFDGAKDGILEAPIYFSKLAYPAYGTGGEVSCYSKLTKQLDYETELTVVIGKKGRDIPKEDAKDYIFGYTICNDWSVRDYQKKHSQWFKAKSFDGHLTMGPFIAYNEIISYPPNLELKTFVNGELRQHARTDLLTFDIDYIISDLSQGLTLYPGDVILTGTCKGVGLGFNPPRFLKAGDKVESYIEKIGTLSSKIID